MAQQFWLVKTEPDVFSWQDLRKQPRQTTMWEGVRNYQARNFLRDGMRLNDGVLFYHSRTKPLAIMGVCHVTRTAYPDPTQFDPKSKYYDPKSSPERPRWYAVDITCSQTFAPAVTREHLQNCPDLDDMMLLQRGSRLSVQPVTAAQWRRILKMSSLK